MIPASLNDFQMLNLINQCLKNQVVVKKVEKKAIQSPKTTPKWQTRYASSMLSSYNRETGPVFPADFDVQTANPKDYFDLMCAMFICAKIAVILHTIGDNKHFIFQNYDSNKWHFFSWLTFSEQYLFIELCYWIF